MKTIPLFATFILFAACSSVGVAPPHDAGNGGSSVADAGTGGGGGGAGEVDAGPLNAVVYPVVGSSTDDPTPPKGPGVILMGGGTDVDDAFVWMHDVIAGSKTDERGDVIVLRATGKNAYDEYIADLAPFNSVRTIRLPAPSSAADLALAAGYVDHAEAVFFAGGDQANYVAWKGSPLMQAVAAVYARGGVVGGTSAGCAIQGPFVFDAVASDAAGGANVQTADAVADPYEPTISFTRDMLAWPTLPGVLTDPHFEARDRMGRLLVFVARQYADGFAPPGGILGVGVDEKTALVVDAAGLGTVLQQPGATGATYLMQPSGAASVCAPGKPLVYAGVKVTRLAAGDRFDFAARCGTGTTYTVSLDGSQSPPYTPSDPYAATGSQAGCP